MDTFVWDDVFVTGLDTVDQQHRRLVDLINAISAAYIEGQEPAPDKLQSIVGELADYAAYHFTEEERLMAAGGISERHLQHHQKVHRSFIDQIDSIWSARQTMSAPVTVLLEFLIAWLSFHILGEDQAMARQLGRIQSGQTPDAALSAEEAPQDKSTSALLGALYKLYHVLSEQNRDLAAANRNLEARVAERTRALEEANRQLEKAARTDGLLGIANRLYFDSCLSMEWQRARRERQPLGLLMIDVDYFKRYNDTYGHQQGDECLKSVAGATLSAVHRPADLVARYGGEELVVLLPNTDAAGTRTVGQAVQARIAALDLPHAGSDVARRVTLSIGGWACVPGQENCPEALIAAADKALYAAKTGGRNRLVMAGEAAVPA